MTSTSLRESWLLPVLAVFFAFACSTDGATSSGPNASGGDSFANLRSQVDQGARIACEADRCCFRQCSNNGILCATRNQSDLTAFSRWSSCDTVILPSWMERDDCWLWDRETSAELAVVQCFCARSNNTFSGEYSAQLGWNGCDLSAESDIPYSSDESVSESACQYGVTSCSGSGGTGGNGAAGSGGGDPCETCLKSCSGLSSCCRGNGCICENECLESCVLPAELCCNSYGDCICTTNCPF